MASVTVNLTGYSENTAYSIIWSDNVELGPTFALDGVGQELNFLRMHFGDGGGVLAGLINFSITTQNDRFTQEFEATGRIIFTASDGEKLEVMIANVDMSEPYNWTPTNSAEVIAFANHVRGLTDHNATLTLTDDPPITVHIPSLPITSTAETLEWFDNPGSYYPLGTALAAIEGQNLYMGWFGLYNQDGVRIRLASTATQGLSTSGPEFSDQMEQNGTIVVVASDGETLTITGITDTTEPYLWVPSNQSEVQAFIMHVDGLTDKSLAITFDDNPDTTPILPSAGPYTRSGSGNITRTLPAATEGNLPLTYSATENDADGSIVSFNPSTREITVNIPTAPATLTVEYEVEDSDGDTDSVDAEFRTTVTSVVPSAPAIPTLTPAINSLIVEWVPPSSSGSHPITNYDIQHRQGTSGDFTLVDPAWSSGLLTYTIENLTGGQSYQAQVRGVSQAGNGSWSTIATTTTLSTSVPGRPDAPTLADGANQFTVTWDPPDDDGGADISAYDIRYRLGSGGWMTLNDAWTSGARTYTITSLSPGRTYQVQVRAVNSIGNGSWSESTEETLPTEIPGAPTITTATPGDTIVSLMWNAPSDVGGADITSYDIRHRIGSGNYTEIDSATMSLRSYTVMNLSNDSTYDFQVRAVNSAGEGPWSSVQMATPMGGTTTINVVITEPEVSVVTEIPRVPGKPLITSVAGSNHSLRLEWNDPEDTGTSVVEYYDVRVRASSLQTRAVEETAWTLIDVASTDADYTIRGLANNVEFDVQVRAINSAGPGLWSVIRSAIPVTTRESTLGLVKLISWNDLLWGITNHGELYFSLDLTAWELHASLPRHHTPVTDMFLFRDRTGAVVIHVMTETSLWVHEHEHERFSRLAVEWPRSDHNGRGSTVWLGDLYIPVGNAVFKYTGGQNPVLTQVGPNRDDGVSWLGTSRITKLVGTHNALLALIQNTEEGNNPEGTSHVLAYDEKGWQSLWTPEDDGHEVLQDIFVETTAGDYSLWMGYGDLAVMDLPTNIVNPYRAPTALRFAPSGYLITPWFNADEVAVRKLGLELVVEAYGLSATKTVQIEYALDYVENIWAQLATLDSVDDEGRTLFDLYAAADDAGEGLIFDAIRFRFTIVSDDAEASPYVAAYVMAFTKQLETKWGYQMTVDLNKPFGTKTADALSESLRTTAAKKKRVPFEYRSGLESDRIAEYVRVERLTMAEKPGYAPGINALVFLIES